MFKKCNKILAFLLAIALVTTTFGSDFANAKVYAVEEELVDALSTDAELGDLSIAESVDKTEKLEENENKMETTGSAATGDSQVLVVENKEDEKAAASTGSTEAVTEGASDKSVEDSNADSATEAAATASTEEAASASSEASTEEIAAIATGSATEGSTETATGASTEGSTETATGASSDAASSASSAEAADTSSSATSASLEVTEAAVAASSGASVVVEMKKDEPFSDSAQIDEDGIIVNASAEAGVLPNDAFLSVKKVSSYKEDRIEDVIDNELGDEADVVETFSYDINICSHAAVTEENPNGYVQPEEGTTVEITFGQIIAAADEETSLAVYHVEDDLSGATEVATEDEKATDITFDAEHFSIYSVVLKENHLVSSDKTYEVKIDVVDLDGNDIDNGGTKNVDLSREYSGITGLIPTDNYYIYASRLAEKLVSKGYTFDSAYYKDQAFDHFYKAANSEVIGIYNGDTCLLADASGAEEKEIVFKYKREAKYTDGDHLDLGFTDDEFNLYKNNGAKIYAWVNGEQYTMGITGPNEGRDDELGTWEYRLENSSIGRKFRTDDAIKFEVDYDDQVYYYEPSESENEAARENCYNAHRRIQRKFGFDYKYSFTDEFKVEGKLIYHKNDESSAMPVADNDLVRTEQGYKFTIKDISEITAFADGRKDYTFKGWALTKEKADEGTVEYVKSDDPTKGEIVVGENEEVNLYAVWEAKSVVSKITIDFLDYDGTKLQDTLTVDSDYKYSTADYLGYGYDPEVGEVVNPTRKNCEFTGWSDPVIDGAGNVTYTAQYTALSYTIKFNKNNNAATGEMDNLTAKFDEEVTLTQNAFGLHGRQFKGWALSSDGEVKYRDKASVKNLATNANDVVDLYAVWDAEGDDLIHYYLLYDLKEIPESSVAQPKGDYHPATAAWSGEATPLYSLVDLHDNHGNVFDTTGKDVRDQIHKVPSDTIDAYLKDTYEEQDNPWTEDEKITEANDVIWYVYKYDETDGYHIDGFPTGSVTYYSNFDVSDNNNVVDSKIRLNAVTPTYSVKNYSQAFNQEREGYKFLGWSETRDGEVVYAAGEGEWNHKLALKKHLKLYAQWSATPVNAYYKVEYYYENKAGDGYVLGDYPNDTLISVSVDAQNPTKEVAVDEDVVEQREEYKGVKYNYISGTPSVLKGDVTKANTQENPLVLKVYYSRKNKGVKVIIKAADDSKYYDGTELTNAGYSENITRDGEVTDEYTVEAVVNGSQLNVNTAKEINNNNVISYVIREKGTNKVYASDKNAVIDSDSLDVVYPGDDGFDITVQLIPGTLLVKPREIVITVPGDEKTYDGEPYDLKNYKKVVSFKVDYADGTDFIDLKLENAYVTVAQNIKTVPESKVANDEFTIKDGYYFTLDGAKVGDNVKVVRVKRGDLVIKPAKVSLKSATLSKKFDGTALTNGNTPLEVETGFVKNEGAVYTFTGSITNVGTDLNTYTFDAKKGTDFANYEIDAKSGTLTIDPLDEKWKIKVSLHADAEGDGTDTWIKYDGTEKTANMNVKLHITGEEEEQTVVNEEQKLTGKAILKKAVNMLGGLFTIKAFAAETLSEEIEYNGKKFTVEGLVLDGGKGTHVGEYDITLDYKNMRVYTTDENGKKIDVTADAIEPRKADEYVEVIGKLHITPRIITVTSGSASKVYDGSPLTNSDYTEVEEDGGATFVMNDGVTYNFTGSRTQVGTSDNTFTYTLTPGTLAKDYEITTVFGTLTVNPYDGGNPPDDNDVPSNDDPTSEDTPSTDDNPPSENTPPTTTTTPDGQVLGAQRGLASSGGDGAAVLGARRGGTDDPTNTFGRIITIIFAAGIGFLMIFMKRKKEDK